MLFLIVCNFIPRTPKSSKLNIKFQIRPDNVKDGVVMYVAESEHANGDFAAVVLKDKHLEFRFNTGASKSFFKSHNEAVF